MHIGVRMGGKLWGGYPFTQANFAITYENDPGYLEAGTPRLWYGYFLVNWVGLQAPGSLYVEGEDKPIISEGDELTHHSAEIFASHYHKIKWTKAWEECASGCSRWCREKQEEALLAEGWEPGEICVEVIQKDTFEDRQLRSSMRFTKEAAERLGKALLAMAREDPVPSRMVSFSVQKPLDPASSEQHSDVTPQVDHVAAENGIVPLRLVSNGGH